MNVADDRDTAAYVDGQLDGRALRRFEERLAAEPALAAEVERQRGAVRAIRLASADVVAPARLRAEVAQLEREAAPARRPARGAIARRSLFPRAGWAAGVGAAAAAVLFVFVLGGGGPTVDEALALATRPPEARVAPDPGTPQLLRAEVEGVRFPNYLAKFRWRAVGQRTDEIDGRTVRTVFYERGGERVAYSIFAGDALDQPGGRDATREGTRLRVFEGGRAVTWERRGHTCVISGASERTLLELAGWKGKGAVAF